MTGALFKPRQIVSDARVTRRFLNGHRKFLAKYFEEREYLQQHARDGQFPKALYIGCSDSRVIPEYLTSSGFGELFVLRNVANFVPTLDHPDASVGAAIDYAVDYLEVPDIIVCGHLGCGGVKAVLDGIDGLREGTPSLHEWLQGIEDSAAIARESGATGESLWETAVRENVLSALGNLITYDSVRRRLEAGKLHIHGWVYDIHSSSISVYDPTDDRWTDAAALRNSVIA